MASGRLPRAHALAVAVLAVAAAEAVCLWFGERTRWPCWSSCTSPLSILYTLVLKHIPVVELVFVASGFVLRALGGASATRVPPSGWFLLCAAWAR